MINLAELLEQLAQNELSQISIKGQPPGVVNSVNVDTIVNNINLALTAIHRRFNLREGRIQVVLHPDVNVYELNRSKVTRLDPTDKRYLVETKNFELRDSLLKVTRVEGDTGIEFILNDLSNPFSLKTPRYNLLEVPICMLKSRSKIPSEYKTENLYVYYQANHPKIGKWTEEGEFSTLNGDISSLNEINIDIPYMYLEPLVYWVASRFHNPVGMTNEFHAGNSFYAKYEAACQRIEHEGYQVDRDTQAGFRRQGWA